MWRILAKGRESEAMSSQDDINKRISPALRLLIRLFGVIFLSLLGLASVLMLFIIALQELEAFRDWVRQFNKHIFNPAVLGFAGRPQGPYAIVHHKGRSSGKSYTTPVNIRQTPEGFIIPLYYGRNVDWCRNVLAAGQCTITWKGNDYQVGEPEVIEPATVLSLIPLSRSTTRIWGFLLSRAPFKAVQYLRVKYFSAVPEGAVVRT